MTSNPFAVTNFVAFSTLTGEPAAQSLALALEDLNPAPQGVGTFEADEASALWEISAYFVERPDEIALDLLAAAYGARPFAVSRMDERDWVAQVKRELTPVVADRFFIYGEHDAEKLPKNAYGLLIEAAMAFGTGHHDTTRGCLLAMSRLAKGGFKPRNVMDVGAGTGVLAMGAARLWRRPALATDIDPVAGRTARENARANSLTPWVFAGTAIGFRHPLARQRAPFDLAVANILANPLKKLAPEMRAHVAPGGRAILSGILNRQANGVEEVYKRHGFRRDFKLVLGEWSTLALKRV